MRKKEHVERVNILLTIEERKKLEALADFHGVGMTQVLRRLMLEHYEAMLKNPGEVKKQVKQLNSKEAELKKLVDEMQSLIKMREQL